MDNKEKLRTLLLKMAVRKVKEDASGKTTPKKEIVGKQEDVKPNESKPNEK